MREPTVYGRLLRAADRVGVWLVIGFMTVISAPLLAVAWLQDHEPRRYREEV